MSQRDQFEIIRALLEATFSVAPENWGELMINYYVDGSRSMSVNTVVVGEGQSAREVSLDDIPNMGELLRELREELAQAGRPLFSHCKIVVASSGQYEATYGYDPVDWPALAISKWNFFPDQKALS